MGMPLTMIAAADLDWGIGKGGRLLIRIPADMKYFRENTEGQILVMGRKTLESLPGGRPLKGRLTVVMTADSGYDAGGALAASSVEGLFEELARLKAENGNEARQVFVAGGGKVYEELLPYASRCLVTRIERSFGADTFFPDLDAHPGFRLDREGERMEWEGIAFRFCEYARKQES